MSRKDPTDDIGFDGEGRLIAIGEAAAEGEESIADHPDAEPVLIVAKHGGDLGIRVFGEPSEEIADMLDEIAATYRQALKALSGRKQ